MHGGVGGQATVERVGDRRVPEAPRPHRSPPLAKARLDENNVGEGAAGT
jgi:hypothetical protein